MILEFGLLLPGLIKTYCFSLLLPFLDVTFITVQSLPQTDSRMRCKVESGTSSPCFTPVCLCVMKKRKEKVWKSNVYVCFFYSIFLSPSPSRIFLLLLHSSSPDSSSLPLPPFPHLPVLLPQWTVQKSFTEEPPPPPPPPPVSAPPHLSLPSFFLSSFAQNTPLLLVFSPSTPSSPASIFLGQNPPPTSTPPLSPPSLFCNKSDKIRDCVSLLNSLHLNRCHVEAAEQLTSHIKPPQHFNGPPISSHRILSGISLLLTDCGLEVLGLGGELWAFQQIVAICVCWILLHSSVGEMLDEEIGFSLPGWLCASIVVFFYSAEKMKRESRIKNNRRKGAEKYELCCQIHTATFEGKWKVCIYLLR